MNDIIDFLMDPLRLTLIIAGVVVLLAIIIFGRKSNRRHDFTYATPSSKEFTFGAARKEDLDDEMLTEEDVIVLPRKQTVAIPQEPEYEPSSNAYNVRTEPKKAQFSEFSPFQGALDGEQTESDVFEDESITSSPFIKKPLRRNKVSEVVIPKILTPTEEPSAKKINKAVFEARDVEPMPMPLNPVNKVLEQNNEAPKQKSTPEKSVKTPDVIKSQAENQTENKPEQKPIPSVPKSTKERFIVLHILAAEGKPFNGLDILDATKTQGLAFGKHAIFHYPMSAAPAGDSKFCLVNMSPTGNFETNKISSLETNGISLIMRLPIRGADSLTVFSNMLGVTQSLARKLGGEIIDQARIPLTSDIVATLRSDIAQFEDAQKASSTAKEPIPEV